MTQAKRGRRSAVDGMGAAKTRRGGVEVVGRKEEGNEKTREEVNLVWLSPTPTQVPGQRARDF